jgi:hypothetical protein
MTTGLSLYLAGQPLPLLPMISHRHPSEGTGQVQYFLLTLPDLRRLFDDMEQETFHLRTLGMLTTDPLNLL